MKKISNMCKYVIINDTSKFHTVGHFWSLPKCPRVYWPWNTADKLMRSSAAIHVMAFSEYRCQVFLTQIYPMSYVKCSTPNAIKLIQKWKYMECNMLFFDDDKFLINQFPDNNT